MVRRQMLSTTTYQRHYPSHSFNDPALASLSYRQLQLPFRGSELPASCNTTQLGLQQPTARMASYMHSEEELAHFQRLSNEYEPEVTGPLVGERQSSNILTTEYANGDPVYIAKTAALPGKYSHYRPCRGDGHCGWRAIAFSYFETLLRLGNRNKFHEEETRLRSLNNLLNAVGFEQHLYEDWADEAFDLLRKLASAGSIPDADSILLSSFNDESSSMSLITYLKLLTSAWIQTHPSKFEPFMLGQDIRNYCSINIERSVCEIDHVGVTALVDVLVMPAGFAVEILYLDRTPGAEANTHRFDPLNEHGLPISHPPTLTLLYRPGHYDLLYKLEDVQRFNIPPPTSDPLYVAFADHQHPHVQHMGMDDLMAYIPGSSLLPPAQNPWPSDPFNLVATSLMPARQQFAPTAGYPAPHPVPSFSHDFLGPNTPLEPPTAMPLSSPPIASHVERGGPFRPSVWELEPEFASGPSHALPFQTSIFRDSPFNTAHFMNPDFEPIKWVPGAENESSGRSRNKHS